MTGAIGKPMLSPKEARAIGKRVGNSLGEKGALGKDLREHKKRGTSSEELLMAAATLNLSPPSRTAAQSAVPAAEDADEAAAEPSPSPPAASVPAAFAFTFVVPVHAPALPPPNPMAAAQIRRLFGSREAAKAIYACRELEYQQYEHREALPWTPPSGRGQRAGT